MNKEEKQALIEHCKTMILASAFNETKLVARIALASLEADGTLTNEGTIPPAPAPEVT